MVLWQGGGIGHMSLSFRGCQGSCCGLIPPLPVLFYRGVRFKSWPKSFPMCWEDLSILILEHLYVVMLNHALKSSHD